MPDPALIVPVLLGTAAFTLAVQMVYYLWFFGAVAFVRDQREEEDKEETLPPVSVIICARNEEKNLEAFLPSVLEQDYPDYEVVVVNDASDDGTEALLERLAARYPRLRHTTIRKDEHFTHAKKLAVLVGVKAARHEVLLFTDADCRPASPQWIRLMARHFARGAGIVLGYGAYQPRRGLWNRFVRYEALFIAMQYMGFALRGIPYMGVGRNLAYRKPFFYEISRRPCFNRVVSGDDDLLVNRLGTRDNLRVEHDPRARTLSVPPPTLKAWFKRKKRHITTARYYTRHSRLLAAGEMISRLLFTGTALALFFTPVSPLLPAAFLLLRYATLLLVTHAAGKRLSEKQLLLTSLLYDLVIPFLYLAVWISNLSRTAERTWA